MTLAESCFSSLGRTAIGAEVELSGALPSASLLFSESPSRIILSFAPAVRNELEKIAERAAAPFTILGQVGGTQLRIKSNGEVAVSAAVSELEEKWRNALSRKLQAEVMAASME